MENNFLTDIFRDKDPGIAQRLQKRIEEQDRWNDVFSTKLIEVLDKIDAIRTETSKRLRRAEELTIAEDALLAAAADSDRSCEQHREAAIALESATSDLQAARHLLADADSMRKEALALKNAAARTGDFAGFLADATKNVSDCAARYESAIALLTEARTQQDAARERLGEKEHLVQSLAAELTQARAEYRRATVQAGNAAEQFTTVSQKAESVVDMATAAQRDIIDARNGLKEAQRLYQDACSENLATAVLARQCTELLNSAEACQVVAKNALGEAERTRAVAEQRLHRAAGELDEAKTEHISATAALRKSRRLAYATVIACVFLILLMLIFSGIRQA